MKLAVFGGTGLTGGLVVSQALEDGHGVTALVRDPRRVSLSHPRLTVIGGNPVSPNNVERCVRGADAVIHCLGIGGKGDGKPTSLISDSVLVTLAAMEQHRVPRIVCMSNVGAGGSGSRFANRLVIPLFVRWLLPIIEDKNLMEAELEGRYLRNGPNPVRLDQPEQHHWFAGPGMVHGVRLRDGRAEWYRNRYVRSRAVRAALGEPAAAGDPPGAPNTNVLAWAGATLAVVEGGGPPVELGYELDTGAVNSFAGTLPGAFSAHSKFDPLTGELHAMCHAWAQWFDHIKYVVVAGDGRVSKTVDIPLPGMVMVHDMSLTRNYAVVYDLPVTVDIGLAGAGRFPFRWNPDYAPRLGLLPRTSSDAADIIWCELDPCYAYHPMNAYDAEDGTVVIDICRYDRMFDADILGPAGDCLPSLYRWTVDPGRQTVAQDRRDDRTMEFPRVAASVSASRHRFGYGVGVDDGFAPGDIYKHDLEKNTVAVHSLGSGRGSGETDFVPREHPVSEDDGWLMSYVYDATTDSSEFVILDALAVEAGPVARVILPQRVPFGFHGNWISDHAVRTMT